MLLTIAAASHRRCLLAQGTFSVSDRLKNTEPEGDTPPGTYINPAEVGMYYLQGRYYDPEVGRFINEDDVSFAGITNTLLSFNLFSYCENNSANYTDCTGEFVQVIFSAIFSAVLSVALYWPEWKLGMRNWNGWTLAFHITLAVALSTAGAFFRNWLKFVDLARMSSK